MFFEREERSKSRVIITKRREEKRKKERNNNACMVMLFAPDHGYRDVTGVGVGIRSEVYQCGSNLR